MQTDQEAEAAMNVVASKKCSPLWAIDWMGRNLWLVTNSQASLPFKMAILLIEGILFCFMATMWLQNSDAWLSSGAILMIFISFTSLGMLINRILLAVEGKGRAKIILMAFLAPLWVGLAMMAIEVVARILRNMFA